MIHYKGMTHCDLFQRSDTLSTIRIKHEINTLLQKLVWWHKNKNVKKEIRQFSSPTAMQTKHKQLQISRSRGR